MKLWVDGFKKAPEGYVWCQTTNEAKTVITCVMAMRALTVTDNLPMIELIDIGEYIGGGIAFGGHFIEVLKFLEKNNYNVYNIPIHFHDLHLDDENIENCQMVEMAKKNNWVVP